MKEGGTKLEGKEYENIHATIVGDGTVGLVALDRPKALNALSHALMVEVVDALQTFDTSSQVRNYTRELFRFSYKKVCNCRIHWLCCKIW